MKQTIRGDESSTRPTLYLAFELSDQEWKLGFTVGLGQSARQRKITAGDTTALKHEIVLAKQRFSLPADAPVMSCYEAGRDGFWLHRFLESEHLTNLVVDSASIEVSRRGKNAKTDRLDVEKLLTMLLRYHAGESRVWSVVHVPSLAAEDQRHLHRQLLALKGERTRYVNRIKGLLVGQGIHLAVDGEFLTRLPQLRLWDGSPLPEGLAARLRREFTCWQFVHQQILELEAERRAVLRDSQEPCMAQVRQLLRLKGIGENSAWLYVMEFFGWRDFHNRREACGERSRTIGALAGLTPTPFQSGAEDHEQGISKAGNTLIRAMAIEIAWGWLRHQPDSALSQWYQERFGAGSTRLHKIGIVALARKLLIALWHYLESGEPPPGATLKPAVA
jgi:transposase